MTKLEFIHNFLNLHLQPCSKAKSWKILEITNLDFLTADPGNEILYTIHLEPTFENPEEYYSEHEPIINLKQLNHLLQQFDETNGDHHWEFPNYIGLNATILLTLVMLK